MNSKNKKIINSILFFANQSNEAKIGRLKLMKLLWLADRVHLNKYGRLILKDSYNALPHGPVPSNAMNYSKYSISDYFDVDNYQINAIKSFDSGCFSKSDIEVLEYVWKKFGHLTAAQLRNFSHKFPEWLRYEKELTDKSLPDSYEIVIDDFFVQPNDIFKDILEEVDIQNSKLYFHSYNAIQSNLDG